MTWTWKDLEIIIPLFHRDKWRSTLVHFKNNRLVIVFRKIHIWWWGWLWKRFVCMRRATWEFKKNYQISFYLSTKVILTIDEMLYTLRTRPEQESNLQNSFQHNKEQTDELGILRRKKYTDVFQMKNSSSNESLISSFSHWLCYWNVYSNRN